MKAGVKKKSDYIYRDNRKAQGLHRLVMAACRAENEPVLKDRLSEIAK